MTQPPSSRVIPIQAVPAEPEDQSFLSAYEKQVRIYPRSVKGWFANWRWVMVWVTQIVFYGLPWVQWNGRQAMLFDLNERRFFIFNLVLHPQDLIYLAALLVIAALALFFFTAVAGRLWCGYACPQTVYTEIFMWFERRIEGDRMARMRLDAAPWSANKLLRKGGKQFAWIGFALVTGFSFVGYFTPIHQLAAELVQWSFSPWEWFWVLFYAGATYGNAGYMREQICKYMCPYARFQSALIDMDSLVIAYDAERGESRGSRSRSADPKALGLGLNVFINISLKEQTRERLAEFERRIAEHDEVMECYLMTGDSDYLIRVAVADIGALEKFILNQLTPIPGIEKIRSSFALKQVRYKTALPLPLPS